jgi:hypothetical protein
LLKGSTPLWDRALLRARARNLLIKLQFSFWFLTNFLSQVRTKKEI